MSETETDNKIFLRHANGVVEVLDVERYAFPAGVATCGACGHSWDDTVTTSVTPAPGARCPFEYDYAHDDELS